MKDYIIGGIVVIIAIVGGWYVLTRPAPSVSAGPTQVMYACDTGQVINATFTAGETKEPTKAGQPPVPGGSVLLTFEDNSTLTLAQTISADGARYANPDESLVFWSKGNGAMVLQSGVEKDFKGCVAVAPVPAGSDLTEGYASSKYGFSMRYPKGFTVNDAYVYQANPELLIKGVKFQIPAALAEGTNLSKDSYMSVERQFTKGECTASIFFDGAHPAQTITANGMTYSVVEVEDAAAGNRYAEAVYAFPGTNPCVAVRFFIHYGVFENYPAGSIKEYDNAALVTLFERMRNTVVINQ